MNDLPELIGGNPVPVFTFKTEKNEYVCWGNEDGRTLKLPQSIEIEIDDKVVDYIQGDVVIQAIGEGEKTYGLTLGDIEQIMGVYSSLKVKGIRYDVDLIDEEGNLKNEH